MLEKTDLSYSKKCLRSIAWANALVAVFASWNFSYTASALVIGKSGPSALVLNSVILFAAVLIVLDSVIRLYHCRAFCQLKLAGKFEQYILLCRFRHMPTHLIDGGDLVDSTELEKELLFQKSVFQHDVLVMAEKLSPRNSSLTRAGAVNLYLFSNLRLKQLKMGWLTA